MCSFKNAKWIVPDENLFPNSIKTQQTVFDNPKNFNCFLFSKTVNMKKHCQLNIKISADVFYIFKINNTIISRGPAAVGGDYGRAEALPWRFFDEFPITLEHGDNYIEILVSSAPIVMADYSSGEIGLLLEAFDENNQSVFYTDKSWNCCIDKSYVNCNLTNLNLPKTELSKCIETNRDFPIKSGLKPLTQKVIKPISITKLDNGYFFDFGKVYPAYIRTTITSKTQSNINIATYEILNVKNCNKTITSKVGTATTESLQMHCMRYLEITSNDHFDVDVELIYTHYPVRDFANFNCDNKNFNHIFEACKRTLKMCMQTYHMDSPVHQEALGCTGDYFIESLINYYTFGETELTKLDILRSAWLLNETKGRLFHTSYGLIWIQWLLDYYNYTGDKKILSSCESSIDVLLIRYDSYCENGLIENPPDYLFIDWILVDEFDLHHPPKNLGQSALNCFYYNALLCASRIKTLLNKDDEAETINHKAVKLKNAFNKTFWDEEKGLYFAGKSDFINSNVFLPISNNKRYFTVHANTLAVLYGLADNGQSIMEKVITSNLIPAQPYFWHFIFEALDKVDLFEKHAFTAFNLWTDLLNECDSSLKEIYHPAGFNCDYSHAWSGSPAYQLPSKVFGVKFIDGKPVYCKPLLGPLNFASGVIPLSNGKILKIEVAKINGEVTRNILTL